MLAKRIIFSPAPKHLISWQQDRRCRFVLAALFRPFEMIVFVLPQWLPGV